MDSIPAGSRLCHLYRTPGDLAGISVPFIRVGIERGERCLWIADDPSLPEGLSLDDGPGPGTLETVAASEWRSATDPSDAEAGTRWWRAKCAEARAEGYGGLRVLIDGASMRSGRLPDGFPERSVDGLSITGLFAFPLEGLDAFALLDAVGACDIAFAARHGAWRQLTATDTGRLGREIAERRRAEEALRESEAFLHSLLDAIPIPVFYKDREGRYLGFNRAYETFFCASREQLIGKSVFDISPHELAEIYFAKDRELFRQGGVQRYESQVKNWRGELRDVIFNKAVFTLRDGEEIGGLIGAILDITDRKRAEAEREKIQAELMQSQKMESIGRLAGGIAHDFNNMLSVIVGYTEMALARLEDDTPLAGDLREVRRVAGRSADLIRQLLGFARRQTVAPRALDMNETVAGMLGMLRRLIGEDIRLNWLPAPGRCPVCMDPSQIDQILVNLCVNAREAIDGAGEITIGTGTGSIDERVDRDAGPGEYVVLSVRDNGRGMDGETVDRVFDPFFTTKPLGEGSGLGLSTVYGIVRQNRGLIDLRSEPGAGTTFRISLPRHAGTVSNAMRDDAGIEVDGGSETVLLVEDEPTLLDTIHRMLERCGYRVVPAATPGEALRVGSESLHEIDLLVSDVIMPGMSGPELMRSLARNRPSLRCVLISGYSGDAIAARGLPAGQADFLRKPFSMRELAAKVREVLDRPEAFVR